MAEPKSRRWTDEDGTEWEVVYNPSVELDTRRDRRFRERIRFRNDSDDLDAPAAYGSELDALSDDDLQGLLDQARRERAGEDSAWEGATDRD